MRTARQKADDWSLNVQYCTKCNISDYCKHKVTHSIHMKKPSHRIDILFIGEAPGQSEYNNREPFIGPAGHTLKAIIEEALDPKTSYCLTNAILCTPWTNSNLNDLRQPSLSEVKECSVHLHSLYKKLKPKKVICLGKVAESAAKELEIEDYIVISHPSKIMQSSKYNYEFDKASLEIKVYVYGQ